MDRSSWSSSTNTTSCAAQANSATRAEVHLEGGGRITGVRGRGSTAQAQADRIQSKTWRSTNLVDHSSRLAS